jgi:hypothetical protein
MNDKGIDTFFMNNSYWKIDPKFIKLKLARLAQLQEMAAAESAAEAVWLEFSRKRMETLGYGPHWYDRVEYYTDE